MCSSRRRRAGDDVGLGTVGVPAGWRGGGDRGLCCLMSSGSFGCLGISRRWWGGPTVCGSHCSLLWWGRPGCSQLLGCLLASFGRTARGWGATGGGLGVLRVGGAFVQYAQPVVSRSRPSRSRPTRGRSGAEPARCEAGSASNHDHRDPAQTAVRGWWGRTCGGDAGLCHQDPRAHSCEAWCPQR